MENAAPGANVAVCAGSTCWQLRHGERIVLSVLRKIKMKIPHGSDRWTAMQLARIGSGSAARLWRVPYLLPTRGELNGIFMSDFKIKVDIIFNRIFSRDSFQPSGMHILQFIGNASLYYETQSIIDAVPYFFSCRHGKRRNTELQFAVSFMHENIDPLSFARLEDGTSN